MLIFVYVVCFLLFFVSCNQFFSPIPIPIPIPHKIICWEYIHIFSTRMGLSNASSRARNYSSTVNQGQGGGAKKAGYPYIVGRTANTSRFIDNQPLKVFQTTLVFANFSRNTGRLTALDYWKVPGM